jgi:hypothetical protein
MGNRKWPGKTCCCWQKIVPSIDWSNLDSSEADWLKSVKVCSILLLIFLALIITDDVCSFLDCLHGQITIESEFATVRASLSVPQEFFSCTNHQLDRVYAPTRVTRHNFSKIVCHSLINVIENDAVAEKIKFQKKQRSEQSQH